MYRHFQYKRTSEDRIIELFEPVDLDLYLAAPTRREMERAMVSQMEDLIRVARLLGVEGGLVL